MPPVFTSPDSFSADWPMWAILIYIIIKDVVPLIAKGIGKLTDMIVPSKMKIQEMEAAAEIKETARTDDLEERTVAAQEKIAEAMVVQNERMTRMETDHREILNSVVQSNQALAILIERTNRRAQEDKRKPSPPPQ